MIGALDGCRIRLDRGREHLKTLQEEMTRYQTGTHGVGDVYVTEFDPRRQRIVLRLIKLPEFPPTWLILAGDAVISFRAALDYAPRRRVGSTWP